MKLYNLANPKFNVDEKRYRNELKYICTEADLQILQSRIAPICTLDQHALADGIYHIRSVYFDTPQNRYYYENENGADPREKFRIRIYNGSDKRILLECKQKERTMTHKDSCTLSKEQCQDILNGDIPEYDFSNSLLNRFLALRDEIQLQPKVIVVYSRTAFVYGPGNVRITFDRNIGSTSDCTRFFDDELPLRPILPTGNHILEIKYDEFLPNFLYSVMSLGQLQQTAFSKYYLCRKFTF